MLDFIKSQNGIIIGLFIIIVIQFNIIMSFNKKVNRQNYKVQLCRDEIKNLSKFISMKDNSLETKNSNSDNLIELTKQFKKTFRNK